MDENETVEWKGFEPLFMYKKSLYKTSIELQNNRYISASVPARLNFDSIFTYIWRQKIIFAKEIFNIIFVRKKSHTI